MNYAHFEAYVKKVERELTDLFGIPSYGAEDIARYMDAVGVSSEAGERSDSQYEMNYRKYGPSVMSERYNISRQAARDRFNRINKKKMERAVSA